MKLTTSLSALAVWALTMSAASAAQVGVTITNNQSQGGLFLTPLFTVLHDGTFDIFNAGSPASAAVTALAEEGMTGGLATAAGARPNGVIISPGGFGPAPIIDPGETASITLNANAAVDRFLSFMSMVIPSNDNFIGNDDPTAYEIFDAAGVFTGLGPIQILGSNVWNAGTEVNSPTGVGAAFSTTGGVGADENGVIGLQGDLSFLLGIPTAAGSTITSVPGARNVLATITVSEVPLPAGAPLLLISLAAFAGLRRLSRA